MTPDVRRVKCPNGHWASVQTILGPNLRERSVAAGQRCPTCRALIGLPRVVKAYGPGLGSLGRVTTTTDDPLTERTYDRRADGTWYAWWESTYGMGHGIHNEYVTDPALVEILENAWKEASK